MHGVQVFSQVVNLPVLGKGSTELVPPLYNPAMPLLLYSLVCGFAKFPYFSG